MRQINYTATLFVILLLSCGNENDTTQSAQETPEALTDNKLDITSYKRYGDDLVEELYEEIVDKSPELKKLEENLIVFEKNLGDAKNKIGEFDSKSHGYYAAGDSKAMSITDSLLRKKILHVLMTSKSHYAETMAPLNSVLGEMAANGSTLQDHHSVLKIILTLPLIEKYQAENMPEKKEFDVLKKQQGKLIKEIDSLTPKY